MFWKLLIAILFGLILASMSWLQTTEIVDNQFKGLVENSKTIVVGTVKSVSTVVRPDAGPKLDKKEHLVILPVLKEYMAGRVYRIKVSDVLKPRNSEEPERRKYLDVFVPGISDLHSRIPAPIEGNEYIFFLENFKDEPGAYAGNVIFQPNGEQTPFDPDAYFSVVQQDRGVIELKKDQGDLLPKIKAILD